MPCSHSLVTLVCCLAVSGCAPDEPASSSKTASTIPDVSWPMHGLNPGEARYSELADINQESVSGLAVAWSYELGSNRGVETTPIIIDGVMYATAPWSVVHAINASTGEGLWQFDPDVPRQWGRWACCDVVNRGVAVWQDRLVFGTLDGRLIALDKQSGNNPRG